MGRSLRDAITEWYASLSLSVFELGYRLRVFRIANTAPCPCCGYLTLSSENLGGYDICPVCFWEDEGWPDSVDRLDEDFGGANRSSLKVARDNFISFGACDKESVKHTRRPYRFEIPEVGPDPDAYFPFAQHLWDSRKAED